MQLVAIDDEKSSLLLFSSNVIDNQNISLILFQKKYSEALTYIETHDVYAVFLDIVMPDVNGIDLAEKIIKIKPNIKIVFITGYAQNITEIKNRIGNNLFDFCYKPYDESVINKILIKLVDESKTKIYFKAFSHFDCFVNDVLIDFNRAKSKELLALLVEKHGSELTLDEAITKLWIDKDPKLAKKLYRDAVCRLRLALKKYNIVHILNVKRGRISLNINYCNCDYWDYLDGKQVDFKGEYMRPYEWSCEEERYLNQTLIK